MDIIVFEFERQKNAGDVRSTMVHSNEETAQEKRVLAHQRQCVLILLFICYLEWKPSWRSKYPWIVLAPL